MTRTEWWRNAAERLCPFFSFAPRDSQRDSVDLPWTRLTLALAPPARAMASTITGSTR